MNIYKPVRARLFKNPFTSWTDQSRYKNDDDNYKHVELKHVTSPFGYAHKPKINPS